MSKLPSEAVLDVDPETVSAFGHAVVDAIVNEIRNPERRPIFPPVQGEELSARLGGPLPERGMAPADLLTEILETLLPSADNRLHPRVMGNVGTPATACSGLIEALVSTLELRPVSAKRHPGPVEIERTVVRWLGLFIGYSDAAEGHITTGGSWANLVGLALARQVKAPWDTRAEGLHGGPRLMAYTSADVHFALDRAAELIGLGRRSLRRIETDRSGRIRLDALDRAIEADLAQGHVPICIVGNAGTVARGAVDPLDALAKVAREHDLWLHVDGAYGAFAAACEEAAPIFAGLARADSIALDPQKWLNCPYEAGCILTRHAGVLYDTFNLRPDYLKGYGSDSPQPFECQFELSRTNQCQSEFHWWRRIHIAPRRRQVRNGRDCARRVRIEGHHARRPQSVAAGDRDGAGARDPRPHDRS